MTPHLQGVLCDQMIIGVLKSTVYTLHMQFFVSMTVLTMGE